MPPVFGRGYFWEGIFGVYLGGYICEGVFGRVYSGYIWEGYSWGILEVHASEMQPGISGYIWEGVYLGYIGGLCRENAAEGSVYLEGILSRVKHRAYALNIPESGTTRNKHLPS